MASSDWEEIKRLAADFQRAQLSSAAHELSERNCIEIVNKLVSLGLIDVIYTTDGKEYLTPQQVEREIRDELIVHGGRINLVDLQQILNVDLSHIESKVNEIVHGDRYFSLIHGQLLDKDYLDRTCEEINETLQEGGQVAIADLAKTFDLSNDFLLSVIESRLGSIIHGSLDPVNRDVIFTSAFIARNIARIRGIFSAITRPVYLVQLVAQYGLPEKLFYSVLDTLIKSGRLSGCIQGHQEKAIFTPDIYSKTQTNYIDSFFKQNGYIEYQSLNKLGITDGKQFLKKRYSSDCMHLATCCIDYNLVEQTDAAIEEALVNKSYVDINPLLPSPFTNEDTALLLQHCLKTRHACTFCDRVVASTQYLDQCKQMFKSLMAAKANKDMKSSPRLFAELSRKEKADVSETADTGEGKQAKKGERNKKALAGGGTKGGGGRGARETSTKKTKNKYRDRMKGEDEVEDLGKKKNEQLQFMTVDEIDEFLQKELKDCDDEEFINEIATYLHRPLLREYEEVAKNVFLTSSGASATVKRHQEFQEKIVGLVTNMRLFEKGINHFEGETRVNLVKHLLRTLGGDIANLIFEMVANDNLMSLPENETFTPDSRLKLLSKLPADWKPVMTKFNSSLGMKELDDFFANLDVVTDGEHCDLMIKKTDKKKERQLLFNHRQALMGQLDHENEPAMALHLTSVILFQYHSNTLLHAPGRCVPQIISHLANYVTDDVFETLTSYQNLVMQQLKGESGGETDVAPSLQLSEKLLGLKDVVKQMKKSKQTNEE